MIGAEAIAASSPSDTPVHQHHFPEPAHHDVLRLDVAVNKTAVVRVLQRSEQAGEEVEACFEWKSTMRGFVSRRELVDDRRQSFALDILHHEKKRSICVDADVVNRHDVRVFQIADRPHLVDKSSERAGIILIDQTLDCDSAANVLIESELNLSHAPTAEQVFLLVSQLIAMLEGQEIVLTGDFRQYGQAGRSGE